MFVSEDKFWVLVLTGVKLNLIRQNLIILFIFLWVLLGLWVFWTLKSNCDKFAYYCFYYYYYYYYYYVTFWHAVSGNNDNNNFDSKSAYFWGHEYSSFIPISRTLRDPVTSKMMQKDSMGVLLLRRRSKEAWLTLNGHLFACLCFPNE